MDIDLQAVKFDQKSVLRHLMELCQHDYSEFNGEDINEHGLYGYRYIDHYWTEKGRHAFFIRVSDNLAGFVLIRQLDFESNHPSYSIAEFFVLRKYRSQGVGESVANRVFDQFPGSWQVHQERQNRAARAFWRKVISRYTGGRFQEVEEQGWDGPIQIFQASQSS